MHTNEQLPFKEESYQEGRSVEFEDHVFDPESTFDFRFVKEELLRLKLKNERASFFHERGVAADSVLEDEAVPPTSSRETEYSVHEEEYFLSRERDQWEAEMTNLEMDAEELASLRVREERSRVGPLISVNVNRTWDPDYDGDDEVSDREDRYCRKMSRRISIENNLRKSREVHVSVRACVAFCDTMSRDKKYWKKLVQTLQVYRGMDAYIELHVVTPPSWRRVARSLLVDPDRFKKILYPRVIRVSQATTSPDPRDRSFFANLCSLPESVTIFNSLAIEVDNLMASIRGVYDFEYLLLMRVIIVIAQFSRAVFIGDLPSILLSVTSMGLLKGVHTKAAQMFVKIKDFVFDCFRESQGPASQDKEKERNKKKGVFSAKIFEKLGEFLRYFLSSSLFESFPDIMKALAWETRDVTFKIIDEVGMIESFFDFCKFFFERCKEFSETLNPMVFLGGDPNTQKLKLIQNMMNNLVGPKKNSIMKDNPSLWKQAIDLYGVMFTELSNPEVKSNPVLVAAIIGLGNEINAITKGQDTTRPPPVGVILKGPPGIGKTVVVEKLEHLVRSSYNVPNDVTVTFSYQLESNHQTLPAMALIVLLNDMFQTKDENMKTPVLALMQSLVDTTLFKAEGASLEDKERSIIYPDIVVVTTNQDKYRMTTATGGANKLDRRYIVVDVVWTEKAIKLAEIGGYDLSLTHYHHFEEPGLVKYSIGRMKNTNSTDLNLNVVDVIQVTNDISDVIRYIRRHRLNLRDQYYKRVNKIETFCEHGIAGPCKCDDPDFVIKPYIAIEGHPDQDIVEVEDVCEHGQCLPCRCVLMRPEGNFASNTKTNSELVYDEMVKEEEYVIKVGGTHFCFNRGVSLDPFVAEALPRIEVFPDEKTDFSHTAVSSLPGYATWSQLPETLKQRFVTLTGICRSDADQLLGPDGCKEISVMHRNVVVRVEHRFRLVAVWYNGRTRGPPDFMFPLTNTQSYEETAAEYWHSFTMSERKTVAFKIGTFITSILAGVAVGKAMAFVIRKATQAQALLHGELVGIPETHSKQPVMSGTLPPWLGAEGQKPKMASPVVPISVRNTVMFGTFVFLNILAIPIHFFKGIADGETFFINQNIPMVLDRSRYYVDKTLSRNDLGYYFTGAIPGVWSSVYSLLLEPGESPVVGDPASFKELEVVIQAVEKTEISCMPCVSIPGDCGKPLMWRGKVVGVHIAAWVPDSPHARSVAQRLSKKEADEASDYFWNSLSLKGHLLDDTKPQGFMKLTTTDKVKCDTTWLDNTASPTELLESDTILLGCLRKYEGENMDVRKTTLFDIFGSKCKQYVAPRTGRAFPLTTTDGRVEWTSPITRRFRTGVGLHVIDTAVMTSVIDELVHSLPPPPFPMEPLTLYEALMGVASNYLINAKDPTKSVGPLNSACGRTAESIFKKLVGREGYEVDKCYMQRVQQLEHIAATGNVPITLCKAAKKNELRTIEQYEVYKTRLFYVPEAEFNTLLKMYLKPIMVHLIHHHEYTGFLLAINAASIDWDGIANQLQGWDLYDADFVGFDMHHARIRESVNEYFVKVAKKLGYSEKNCKIVSVLLETCFRSFILIENVLTMCMFRLVSGLDMTSGINCASNMLINNYVARIIMNREKILGTLKEHLLGKYGGDDLIVGYSKTLSKFLTGQVLKDELAKIGYDITSAVKTIKVPFKRPLEEITFYKRGFVFREGRWYSPLDKESIYRSLAYSLPTSIPQEERDKSAILSACKEMYLHGKEEFTSFISLVSHLIIPPLYEDYHAIFMADKFVHWTPEPDGVSEAECD